jgi:hypothetical protein
MNNLLDNWKTTEEYRLLKFWQFQTFMMRLYEQEKTKKTTK